MEMILSIVNVENSYRDMIIDFRWSAMIGGDRRYSVIRLIEEYMNDRSEVSNTHINDTMITLQM